MKVIVFVGKSGTGKSYKVIQLAKEQGIEYIIDDGILIRGNSLIAGRSAKSEDSKIAAVKRALFLDQAHRAEVMNAIDRHRPESIIIIGTSENMVEKIVRALELGQIDEKIYIEEVSSPEDLENARSNRMTEGKHVIPLPTFEVKKDFSGHFKDTLTVIMDKGRDTEVYEKTVVRPTFSYLGKYSISDKVIRKLIKHISMEVDGVDKAYRVYNKKFREGIVISVDLFLKRGYNIPRVAEDVQDRIVEKLEYMTEINVLKVHVNISKIVYKAKDYE